MSRDRLKRLAEAIENLIAYENSYPDPPSAHHIPHDEAQWFVEAAKHFLSGDAKSLDSALGLLRRRGRPFDPATSENLDLAEEAFRLKHECNLSWKKVVDRIATSRPQPVDERTIRKIIESHLPAIYRRRADALVRKARGRARQKAPIKPK